MKLGAAALSTLVDALKASGELRVFVAPGARLGTALEALLERHRVAVTRPAQVESTAFVAAGYARLADRLALCFAPVGLAAASWVPALARALEDGVPILVITQAGHAGLCRGAHAQEAREDLVAMLRPFTRYSAAVHSRASLMASLRTALHRAMCGNRGPSHLHVPVELWTEPGDELDAGVLMPLCPELGVFDPEAVNRAVSLLLAAAFPVIVAGPGVERSTARDHLLAVAEQLPARVATTGGGKGVFPEDHPLSLGVMGGGALWGNLEGRRTVIEHHADVVLTVGTRLHHLSALHGKSRSLASHALIQIEVEAERVGDAHAVDLALLGDAQTVLAALIRRLHRSIQAGATPSSQWGTSGSPRMVPMRSVDAAFRVSDREEVTPESWRAALAEVLPASAVVVSASGRHGVRNLQHLAVTQRQRFILDGCDEPSSFATAVPVGVALATGERCVVALLEHRPGEVRAPEFKLAKELELPIVWIVEHEQPDVTVGAAGPAAPHPLEPAITTEARDAGLRTWRVSTLPALQAACAAAMAGGGPALIEVLTLHRGVAGEPDPRRLSDQSGRRTRASVRG